MRAKICLANILFIITLFICSCSVEKRLYNSGYSVNWNHSTTPISNTLLSVKSKFDNEFEITQANTKAHLVHCADEDIGKEKQIETSFKTNQEFLMANTLDSCDVIVTMTGRETRVKIIEILADEVTYLNCNYLEGPLLQLRNRNFTWLAIQMGQKKYFTIEISRKKKYRPFKKQTIMNMCLWG